MTAPCFPCSACSFMIPHLLSMALMLQLQNFGFYMSQLGLQLSCKFGAGSGFRFRILSLLSHLQSALRHSHTKKMNTCLSTRVCMQCSAVKHNEHSKTAACRLAGSAVAPLSTLEGWLKLFCL